jgi:hypothetical protein
MAENGSTEWQHRPRPWEPREAATAIVRDKARQSAHLRASAVQLVAAVRRRRGVCLRPHPGNPESFWGSFWRVFFY